MVASLNDPGTFIFNGHDMTGHLYRSKIIGRPIPDSANRVNVGVEYEIELDGYVNSGAGGTDSTMQTMRQALTAYCGGLLYDTKGFGALKIDGAPVDDAAYGPKPTYFSFDPVGNTQTCKFSWRCKTIIPECIGARYKLAIMEFCYDLAWNVDSDGFTVRTTTGHVVIPATRSGPRSTTIPDNADRLRDQVVPAVPLGFQRTQSFKLSEDKRRLDFTVTDTQLAVPLPTGASNADVRHRVMWKRQPSCAWLTGSISGTITPPADLPRSIAWDIFFNICKSRCPALDAAVALAPAAAGVFFVDSLEAEESLFGRSSSFTFTYHHVGTSLQSLLALNNLWKPIPNTGFQAWQTSMAKAQNVRGQAGMLFQNSDDSIFSLCDPGAPKKVNLVAALAPESAGPNAAFKPFASAPRTPPPNKSWIAFQNILTVVEDDRVARHKPLSTVPKDPVASLAPTGGKLATDKGGIIAGVATTQQAPDKLQRVNSASYRVRMTGWALRLKYDIPLPQLDKFQGQTTTQLDCIQSQGVWENVGGMNINFGAWDITYAIPGSWMTGAPPDYDNPAFP